MYKIDSMYEAMADAVVKAALERRVERWVAAAACWLGRQQILSARDFWYGVAAQVTSLLPADDKAAIEAQLTKPEDVIFADVTDWPEIPGSLQATINSWSPEPAEISLEVAKAGAIAKVDRAAEAHRMTFITAGFGQVMTYQQKLVEARAQLANPSIADADVPHIVSEAAATGKTKMDVAQEIVLTFEGWLVISASIEGKRMAAKAAIAGAETVEEVDAAASVTWTD